ncbi:hypothetical protein DMH25_16720 [Streptomyces sp. WAC 01325]|uniref:hypothetical protein n=1 Tax=Streptomyces sp. WAC 01325 TaxID=2203202 RepID=UPI000F8689ED|nr:hypothetical protein [Streptomyces sp. WAC 01325]RSN08036.1 hypothetical protein DMH25_16720 [Streptomyces sp. WAC 01325]
MIRYREVYYVHHEGDFGLTGLAGKLSSRTGPSPDASTVLALATQAARDDEDIQLGRDVRLLLRSPLPDDALHSVWLTAVRQRFDPADHGMDMRTWLNDVAEVCPSRAPRPTGEEPVVPEAELRGSVLAEIETTAAALMRAVPERDIVSALGQVVTEADADLGFRLFLRALKACGVVVDEDQYDRLLAIGERLAYPLTAVFEELDVRWPPLDPGRRDFEFGFGLPGLSRMFDGDWDSWRYEGRGTPREHIERLAHADSGMPPGAQAAVLLEDVTRLMDSPLSDDTVTALWRTAARRWHAVDVFDADGRTWLREIVQVCVERLAAVDPVYTPHVSTPRRDLADPVVQEIQEIAEPLDRATAHDGMAGTLEALAIAVDPDLGFRLLVRMIEAYGIPVTQAQYARYRELGRRFGHHDSQVADAVEDLVER